VEILFTADDLLAALQEFSAGKVENLQILLEAGAVLVRMKVTDKLPVAVPVELRFAVRRAEQTLVEAGVTWSNMPLLPGFLKELALAKAFEALPGEYKDGIFTMDVADLLEETPVGFRIGGVHVDPGGLRVALLDVNIFPVEPFALVEVLPALVPAPSRGAADLPEHQDYYQKLRERVARFAAAKAPRWAQPLVPWVLAVPDFFVLMVRLARDPRVPPIAKVIAGVAVAYIIAPVDLIPDVIPLIGEADDVAVALFAVEQIATRVPAHVVQENWPGQGQVLDLVKEGTNLFTQAMPAKMLVAIRRLLSREK
jgi:uncharacterized membrane protein YkvA (DUF1232 family)